MLKKGIVQFPPEDRMQACSLTQQKSNENPMREKHKTKFMSMKRTKRVRGKCHHIARVCNMNSFLDAIYDELMDSLYLIPIIVVLVSAYFWFNRERKPSYKPQIPVTAGPVKSSGSAPSKSKNQVGSRVECDMWGVGEVVWTIIGLNKRKTKGPTLKIFFGSQTGTAEDFAGTLAQEGTRYGFNAEEVDLEGFTVVRFSSEFLSFPSFLFRVHSACEHKRGTRHSPYSAFDFAN